jgi:hypothetical protein
MDTRIPTKDQYDSFVTYFTNYLVKVLNIRSRNDFFYLTEMRKLNALFGSRISNGQTLRLRGGSKHSKHTLRESSSKAKTVRQILKDRHDRQPSSITYKVMGYSMSPDNIDMAILLAMAAAGGTIMLSVDPHSLDYRGAALRASAVGAVGTYTLFAAFGFLLCFYITGNYKISKAVKEVAWIRKIVETMTDVETKSPVDPMTMMMMTQVTQQTRYAPSLFPTYNRYTQIMQAIIRESMQMHHRDDGVDEQRLCILSTACLAGIVARKLLQPQLNNSRMGGNIIGRLGTIHRVLRMLENAAKSRTSYLRVAANVDRDPNMFPFFDKVTHGLTKDTSS